MLSIGNIFVREQGKAGGDILMNFGQFQKAITIAGHPLYGRDLACVGKWRDFVKGKVFPRFLAYGGTDDLSKGVRYCIQDK